MSKIERLSMTLILFRGLLMKVFHIMTTKIPESAKIFSDLKEKLKMLTMLEFQMIWY